MSRFLLYYMGKGPKPSADVAQVRRIPGVVVVNDSLPRSVVLDVLNELAEQRLKKLSAWTLQASKPVSLDVQPVESASKKRAPGFRLV